MLEHIEHVVYNCNGGFNKQCICPGGIMGRPFDLALQQRRHLLDKILDDSIGASLYLKAGRNSMQFNIGIDGLGNFVDLLCLLVGPH